MTSIVLVAATYTYFLIFAQFALLRGIHAAGHEAGAVKLVLAVMAVSGISASLAASVLVRRAGATAAMIAGALLAGSAAALSAFALGGEARPSIGFLMACAATTGLGLGLLTVGLASDLGRLTGGKRPGLHVGTGTAIAYFTCNVPSVFLASSVVQCWIAAICAAVAGVAAWGSRPIPAPTGFSATQRAPLPDAWGGWAGLAGATLLFLALVWFDSAAFAAVQLSPEMRARFWGTASVLWSNGIVHASAALAGGWLLDMGLFTKSLMGALIALVLGNMGFRLDGRAAGLSALLYVAGVSLYSTALVAFASLHRTTPERPVPATRAGLIYAVAGWFGSTAGVGLAEQEPVLPAWTPLLAAGVFALGLLLPSLSPARTASDPAR